MHSLVGTETKHYFTHWFGLPFLALLGASFKLKNVERTNKSRHPRQAVCTLYRILDCGLTVALFIVLQSMINFCLRLFLNAFREYIERQGTYLY